jgi:hypothetical protein
MKIVKKIPAVKTFDLPAGLYKAVLTQCRAVMKQSKKGAVEWVRLVFEVKVPGLEDQIPCAGRNFQLDLNPGTDLRNFLEVWLGSDFFKLRSNQELDFETLVGREGDISLSHFQGDEFDKPLVVIDNVFPPNSQKLTEAKPVSVAPNVKIQALAEKA